MRETICGHSKRGCHSCGSRNPVLIHRSFRINHPRTGCSALSTSTSMAFSISLSVFLFEMQIPKIHGFHTKPDSELYISE